MKNLIQQWEKEAESLENEIRINQTLAKKIGEASAIRSCILTLKNYLKEITKGTKYKNTTPGPWIAGTDPCHYDAPEVKNEKWAIYVPTDEDARFIADIHFIFARMVELESQVEKYKETWKRMGGIWENDFGAKKAMDK